MQSTFTWFSVGYPSPCGAAVKVIGWSSPCPVTRPYPERAMQQMFRDASRLATTVVNIVGLSAGLFTTLLIGPVNGEEGRQNRSRFEYHDGRAEEKRPYRRPDLDTDPTNLKMEELRERINALEERLELLERNSNNSK